MVSLPRYCRPCHQPRSPKSKLGRRRSSRVRTPKISFSRRRRSSSLPVRLRVGSCETSSTEQLYSSRSRHLRSRRLRSHLEPLALPDLRSFGLRTTTVWRRRRQRSRSRSHTRDGTFRCCQDGHNRARRNCWCVVMSTESRGRADKLAQTSTVTLAMTLDWILISPNTSPTLASKWRVKRRRRRA